MNLNAVLLAIDQANVDCLVRIDSNSPYRGDYIYGWAFSALMRADGRADQIAKHSPGCRKGTTNRNEQSVVSQFDVPRVQSGTNWRKYGSNHHESSFR